MCTQAIKEYVSILTKQAKCGERGWRVETRTREQGEMGEDYDLLCNFYSASSVDALGHAYDHIKTEALDLQKHVIKVPSSFRLTMCTENQCAQCQKATQIRQAEDPTWSVSRVLAPLASNRYKPWFPCGECQAQAEGDWVAQPEEFDLGNGEVYADDGYPSFLEHVRAGSPQVQVKIPTKKNGHENIQQCTVKGCKYVSSTFAEHRRHAQTHHCKAPSPIQQEKKTPAQIDIQGIDFNLDGAIPVLPPPKKKKMTPTDDDVMCDAHPEVTVDEMFTSEGFAKSSSSNQSVVADAIPLCDARVVASGSKSESAASGISHFGQTTIVWKGFLMTIQRDTHKKATGLKCACALAGHHTKGEPCQRTRNFQKYGGAEEVEHMLKAWAINGVVGGKSAHKDCVDAPVADRMPLHELEAFEIAPDAMDPIVQSRHAGMMLRAMKAQSL